LKDFSVRVSAIQERITSGKETVDIEYKPSFAGPWEKEDVNRWLSHMKAIRAHEMALGATATGPHRDDLSFVLNGRPARSFASEGQKRTCAVAFKLAEIPFIEEKLGQRPICLLDDVLSELDANRAEHLLNELSRTGQCFVTMTGLESWPRHCALPASIFHVDADGIRADQSMKLISSMEK
jgi:DNA replication and repair protein RecF